MYQGWSLFVQGGGVKGVVNVLVLVVVGGNHIGVLSVLLDTANSLQCDCV
jgi:hypothetical protein